jgi:hypothetical protein
MIRDRSSEKKGLISSSVSRASEVFPEVFDGAKPPVVTGLQDQKRILMTGAVLLGAKGRLEDRRIPTQLEMTREDPKKGQIRHASG